MRSNSRLCSVRRLTALAIMLPCPQVPYEKGFLLLAYLEKVLGGPDVFDTFIPRYFQASILYSVPMRNRTLH